MDQTITLSPGDTLTISVPAAAPAPDPIPAVIPDPPALAVVPDPAPAADPVPAPDPAPAPSEADLAAAAQAQAAADQATAAQAAHASGVDGTYTVQPGDTLDSIAAAIYGPDPLGAALFDANSAVIGSDPTAPLAPGTVLAVPVLTIDPAAAPAS